jgi:hypothetical protein
MQSAANEKLNGSAVHQVLAVIVKRWCPDRFSYPGSNMSI